MRTEALTLPLPHPSFSTFPHLTLPSTLPSPSPSLPSLSPSLLSQPTSSFSPSPPSLSSRAFSPPLPEFSPVPPLRFPPLSFSPPLAPPLPLRVLPPILLPFSAYLESINTGLIPLQGRVAQALAAADILLRSAPTGTQRGGSQGTSCWCVRGTGCVLQGE